MPRLHGREHSFFDTTLPHRQAEEFSVANTIKSKQDNLDDAAVCMTATEPQASCTEDIKDFLCRVYCCADAHPFQNENGNEYKQACADKLLTALRLSGNGGKKNKCGTIGGKQYHNSYKHDMAPMTAAEKELHSDMKDDPDEYFVKNDINGNQIEYKERIPDVTVFDANMNIDTIYDFKFPHDSEHPEQHRDYVRLAGYDESKVVYLDNKSCKCDNKQISDKENSLSPEEKQKTLDKIHNAIPDFYGTN